MKTSARVATFGLVLTVAVVLAPRFVWAHAEPYSWVDIRLEPGTWRGTVTAHVVDLAHEIELATADSLLAPRGAERDSSLLMSVVDRLLHLEADGVRVHPHWTDLYLVRDRQAVAFAFEVPSPKPPQRLRLEGPVFQWEPFHETYFNVYEGKELRHQDVLDARRRSSTYTTGAGMTRVAVVRRFLAEGVHHIFIGPDHILFIIGLLLLGGSVRQLLKIVSAFTLAHSVTLALAATGLVTPPARIVEPAIALSIVYVGAANLFGGSGRHDRRVWAAAGFGLVHGFGFASVLRELGLPRQALAWSLFAFNVGVEIGQACIVLAVAPLLALLRSKRPRLAMRTVTVASLVVVAAGAYWFVQRALRA
jgi:hydrogenase/urease accessory protein HupE